MNTLEHLGEGGGVEKVVEEILENESRSDALDMIFSLIPQTDTARNPAL
jgi:hypothetical protein